MSRRLERVKELLRQEISELLASELKDPRLAPLVTVMSVDVSADLRYAKVFTSIMGTPQEKDTALQGLNSACGFLRRQLRHRLSLRTIPYLRFLRDDSIEQGAQTLGVMNQLHGQEKV